LCDVPDHPRNDVALVFFGGFQHFELFGRAVNLYCFLYEGAQLVRLDGARVEPRVWRSPAAGTKQRGDLRALALAPFAAIRSRPGAVQDCTR
jgi:hypothetical protein